MHFVLETLYHVVYGQFLPLLLVDYIAVGLLVYAGVLSLRVRPAWPRACSPVVGFCGVPRLRRLLRVPEAGFTRAGAAVSWW